MLLNAVDVGPAPLQWKRPSLPISDENGRGRRDFSIWRGGVDPISAKQGHGGGMGIIDTVKNFVSGHDKQVDELLGKAGDKAKTQFAGHDGQIDGLVGQARQRTGGGDTTTPPPTGTPNPDAPGTAAPAAAPNTASTPKAEPTSEPVAGEQSPSTGPTPQP